MKPIDNLLRQRLYRAQMPNIEHPPIDLLGAFSEKALSGPDRAPVLEHLAHCADCREIVFLASQEVVQAPANPVSRSSWIGWPAIRWATAAACAVIVVTAMKLHPDKPQSYTEVLTAKQPTVLGTSPNADVSARPFDTRTSPVRKLRAIPGKAKDAPQFSASQLSYRPNSEMTVANPKLPPRWTLTAAGTVQRSLDGGITWQRIQVAHDRIFRSVAAAGPSIWLGGQNGILFHSSDAGQHWRQIKASATKPLPQSDIIGIEFEDGQHGKLTTASNESWITSDAGRSWQKQ
jgi:hypothetical protein